MEPGKIVDLTAGETATVALNPSPSGNPVKGVILSNQSGYLLTVQASEAAILLPPWFTDYVPVPPNLNSLQVGVGSSQINGASTTPQLVPTLVWIQDPTPSGYPVGSPLTIQVENTSDGTLQTYQKSPPAIGTVNSKALTGSPGSSSASGLISIPPADIGVPSTAAGNLIIVNVILQLNQSYYDGYYNGVAANGWNTDTTPVAYSYSTSTLSYYSFLFWAISSGGLGAIEIQGPVANEGFDYSGGILYFGSGSASGFSNPSLTGAVSDVVAWSASGVSDPNLNLATQGLWIATIGESPTTETYSVGTAYSSEGLWMASGQIGALQVESSGNPVNYNGNSFGLVIPQ